MFKHLADTLGNHYPVYGLQMQGTDGQSALPDSMDVLVDYFYEAIISLGLRTTIYLLGFSGGGFSAWELARRFKGHPDITVQAVIMLDSQMPKFKSNATAPDVSDDIQILAQARERREERQQLKQKWRKERGLKTQQKPFLKRVVEAILPEQSKEPIDLDDMTTELRLASLKMMGTYRPEPLDCPLIYLKALYEPENDGAEQWEQMALGQFKRIDVPLPHTMMTRAYVKELVQVLEAQVFNPSF